MFSINSSELKIKGFQLGCPFLALQTSTLYQPAQHTSRSVRYQ